MNSVDRIRGAQRNPDWFEARLPAASECSLGELLRTRAAREPQREFLIMEEGRSWSNEQAFAECLQTASRLAALGLKRGDRLALCLQNGPELIKYLFAAWMLGVIPVPINVWLRGVPLERVLALADAKLIVVSAAATARLLEVRSGLARPLIVIGGSNESQPPIHPAWRAVREHEVEPCSAVETGLNQPWDTAAILFSSGTTGIPKGVQVTFAQLWSLGTAFYGYMRRDDRMLLVLPLFHILTLGALFGSVIAGGSLAVVESFRGSQFWSVVRRFGATTVPGFGRTIIDVLNKQPQTPQDADNPLRCLVVQCVTPQVREFMQRFRCDVIPCYSLTETSCVTISEINPSKLGSMGRPRTGVEVRIVDEHDCEVPIGESGEIIVRADLPWVLSAGYVGDPQTTMQAWRNGWFHTRDIGRRDADGDIFFVDRCVDVIRRRGENISSIEVEAETARHPGVQDVAAVGVETAVGEEILLTVTRVPGAALEPAELFLFLKERLPHYMVPRFIHIVAELPKTPTGKVQKTQLRQQGLPHGSWDCEVAGIAAR